MALRSRLLGQRPAHPLGASDMPVVPVEQNRVGFAEVSGAKFRAPDTSGGVGDALAAGANKIAGAVAQYAITQEEIQDHADKLAARNLALEYKAKASKRAQEFGSLKGVNAVNESANAQAEIDGLKNETLARASNPRQRAYLEPFIAEAHPDVMNGVADHSRKEQFAYSSDTYAAEAKASANEAALNFVDPEKQAKSFATGDAAIDRLGKLHGWGPELVSEKKLELRSSTHLQVMDTMLAGEDPDVYAAEAYFEANKSQMTPAHRNAAMKDMQNPLQWRQAEEDIAGIAPIVGADGTPETGVVVTGGYNAAGLKAKIRGPESGGDDRATNRMGSSASGRYQFTKGTFVSLYNQEYGKGGEEAWANKRFDTGIQEKLMDRLMGANKKALEGAGLPVSDGNMYVLHVLGPGDGIRLLKADPNAPVSSLLSAEIVQKNPSYFGKGRTVQQSVGVITGKVGGAVTTAEAPQGWDKNAAYDELDKRAAAEGWSPERLERAKGRMDVKIQRDEQMLGRQQRQADEQALETVTPMGENFTSMNQIPRAVREKMSPETRLRFQEQAQKNLTAKTTTPDDTQDSVYLQQMRRQYPDDFANVNLSGYVGKVSGNDLKNLQLEQGSTRRGMQLRAGRWVSDKPKPKDDMRSGISGAITWGNKYGGVKVGDKEWPAYYDAMEGYLLTMKEKKGRLDPEDYESAFRWAARTNPANSKPNAVVLRDGIPADFEAEFRRNWRGSKPPTRGQIISAYTKFTTGI